MPQVAIQETPVGLAYRVEFDFFGRRHATLFTHYAAEAQAWLRSVRAYGWCVSGRPLPMEMAA